MSHKRKKPTEQQLKVIPGKTASRVTVSTRMERKDFAHITEVAKRTLESPLQTDMPLHIQPMQPSVVAETFNSSEWQFEFYPEGIRAIAYLKNENRRRKGMVRLDTGEDICNCDTIKESLHHWHVNAVVDGVIVSFGEASQPYEEESELKAGNTFFYVYDLLWLDGIDLRNEPLWHRQKILSDLLPESGLIRFCDHIDESGEDFLNMARENQQQKIIAKKKNSVYTEGVTTEDWLEIHCGLPEQKSLEIQQASATTGDEPSDELALNELLMTINGQQLDLTGITCRGKQETRRRLISRYYSEMAAYILPYVIDKPQEISLSEALSINLKSNRWIRTFEKPDPATGETKTYLIYSNAASIVYASNTGNIEIAPWHSRVQQPQYPDWCVLSIVQKRKSFEPVAVAAHKLHLFLKGLGIAAAPKTAANGIDIFIPTNGKYHFEQVRQFGELLTKMIEDDLKDSDANWKKDVSIIYESNKAFGTSLAPYSLMKNNLLVSTPLEWQEITNDLDVTAFNILSIYDRVEEKGDLFSAVWSKGVEINHVIRGLSTLMAS